MAFAVIGEAHVDTAESKNLSMRGNFKRENREIPEISTRHLTMRLRNGRKTPDGDTADMYVSGKSDDFVVPTKLANKTGTPAAESMEGRGSPKSSRVRFALAPDTVPDHAVCAKVHARHVAMDSSRPSSLNGGAV